MYPAGIFSLDRCLQGANDIKEDSIMGKEQSSIEYQRYVRNKTILRKKRISNSVYGFDWCHHDGQYSKGKIHCGCGLCKFGKKYGLPTVKCMRDRTMGKILMKDWESDLYNLD